MEKKSSTSSTIIINDPPCLNPNLYYLPPIIKKTKTCLNCKKKIFPWTTSTQKVLPLSLCESRRDRLKKCKSFHSTELKAKENRE